jgi:hypothetical protein
MNVLKGISVVLLFVLAVSCAPDQEVRVYSVSYFFKDSTSGWTGDFADYPQDTTGYHLHFGLDTLPFKINTDSTKKALRISGISGEDGLFMFIKKKVSGLRANTTYELLFNVRVASNVPLGVVDGATPGEGVYVKVGGTTYEPNKQLVDGVYSMNLDKGGESEDGGDMIVVGHIGVATTTTDYAVIVRNNNLTRGVFVRTDERGELWVIVGTDSLYEGETTLYYTQVDVLFNQSN